MSALTYMIIVAICSCKGSNASTPSVIIVGAGPAGIAAATKLLENAITNITILEAEDRIGGRIKSVRFGEAIVDLGAEYCHGQKNNIVFDLANPLGLLRPATSDIELKMYYSNSTLLNQPLFDDLFALYMKYVDDGECDDAASLGQLFNDKFNKTLFKKYENDPESLKILHESVGLIESFILASEGAYSWFEVKAKSHWENLDGEDLIWKGVGYKIILDILMKAYPDPSKKLPIDDKIRLNEEVQKITWNEARVKVETKDKQLDADYVIFTPSLGVLKALHASLFNPNLPPAKLEALNAIGFDGVLKIVLEFEEKWWRKERTSFTFLWGEDDVIKANREFPSALASDGASWITKISYTIPVANNSNVQIAWVTGDVIPKIEQLPLDEVKRGVAYVLDQFLGKDYNVTAIKNLLRTTWVSDAHFRGTYSFEKVGSKGNVSYQSVLAEPLLNSMQQPGLLFAGEATNPHHFSTVHGAIETGYREADRIINLAKYKQANQV